MCSKAILALLVYGIIMHCSVYCSPAAGLQYPALRLEDEVYDEDGNTLQDFAYDHEPLGIANPSSMIGEMYTLYYPPEKRHADGIFNKAYRKLLGQLSARKYLHSLMAKRVGGASGGLGDDAEPLTKRHIDGIFTDSYSRYRKQMAVKKYLAAVLGKSPSSPTTEIRPNSGKLVSKEGSLQHCPKQEEKKTTKPKKQCVGSSLLNLITEFVLKCQVHSEAILEQVTSFLPCL
uniref:Adenylate cyclase activating polypeptide 1 n=3 Tax=Neoaves TaxID=3078114 RepID=A0A8U7MEG1_CORMO